MAIGTLIKNHTRYYEKRCGCRWRCSKNQPDRMATFLKYLMTRARVGVNSSKLQITSSKSFQMVKLGKKSEVSQAMN